MEILSTFITNIPHILWKIDRWEWRKLTFRDILHQRFWQHLIRFSTMHSHWLFSCFPRNSLHTSLDARSISLIVASKFSLSKSWRIWGPTNTPSFIFASLFLWKITFRYWKHGLVCFSALVNYLIRSNFISKGCKSYFLYLN